MAAAAAHPARAILLVLLAALPLCICSNPSISVSPTVLASSGDVVRIRWSGIDSPSELDWVGIYSPPSSPHRRFIGYLFLSSCPDWRSGSGSLDLPLTQLRANYAFRIFRGELDSRHHDHDQNPLPGTHHLLAASAEVGFAMPGAPGQIHLSFTDREDEMRVMFLAADRRKRYVNYGLEAARMDAVAGTEVGRYELSDMCAAPANTSTGWRDPGFVHDGIMKNLTNGRRYYYKVGSDGGGWSPVRSFVSRDGSSNETTAFLFGDMGTWAPYATFRRLQKESTATVKWILRDLAALGDKPAFVSHVGDISYAIGYAWLWDEFFHQIEPIAAQVAYHVCIGNHEYDWPSQPWKPSWSYASYGNDGGGECGVPYSLRFKMPGNSSLPTGTGAPATRNLYYSFDAGVVHFLYISTETDFLPGSDQYSFIKRDLEKVDRGRTPFVVVQGHRPMYTTSNELRDARLREKMREALEPLLVRNGVSLAVWGHVHRYERFCAMRNFSCAGPRGPPSPVHVVVGMAGQEWQPIWEPRADHPDAPIFPQPRRSMYRGGEFGYTRLVATREKLTLTYVGNHDGEVHDVVEISSAGHALERRQEQGGKVVTASANAGGAGRYVEGVGVLLLGGLVGYLLGFLSRTGRGGASKNRWIPVRCEET